MTSDDRAAQLAELAEEIRRCSACPLHKGRTNAVPGEGPLDARIMFIGEGPGVQEDRQGRPFVGPSGQLLEQLLAEIGLTREDVVILNVVKCRPPGNRDPNPEEIAACAHFLDRQIELIDPSLIATLGRYSMEKFFPGARITRVHGKAEKRGRRVYLPLFHPAYVLRNESELLPLAVRDFKLIPRLLARLDEVLAQEMQSRSAAAPGNSSPAHGAPTDSPTAPAAQPDQSPSEAPQQLSLF
jgi:uracil-DNA glycosylase family 4